MSNDWGVMLFLALILVVFILRIWQQLSKWNSFISSKKFFFEFIKDELKNADSIIHNIAGDISWLKEQRESYKEILSKGVRVVIFYSEVDVNKNNDTLALISEYKINGAEMVPYPFNIESKFTKGMLIGNGDESSVFYSFSKEKGNRMKCTVYEGKENELILAKAFIESIKAFSEYKSTSNIYIGVLGVNNIGKTTLCNTIKNKYHNENIIIIEDSFNGNLKCSDFNVAIFCLYKQISQFANLVDNPQKQGSIYIFDRTPLDNLIHLLQYRNEEHRKYEVYIEDIRKLVNNFMVKYDLLILLEPDYTQPYSYKATTNLDKAQRKVYRQTLSKLSDEIHSKNLMKFNVRTIKTEDWTNSIIQIADDVIKELPE